MFQQLVARDFGSEFFSLRTAGVPDDVLALPSVRKLLSLKATGSRRSCRIVRRTVERVLHDLGVKTSRDDTRTLEYPPTFNDRIHVSRETDAESSIGRYLRMLPEGADAGVSFDSGSQGLGMGRTKATTDRNNTITFPYYWAARARSGEHPVWPYESHEKVHIGVNAAAQKRIFHPWSVDIAPPPNDSPAGTAYPRFRTDELLSHFRELSVMCDAARDVSRSDSMCPVARANFQDAIEDGLVEKLSYINHFALITLGLGSRFIDYGNRFFDPLFTSCRHTLGSDHLNIAVAAKVSASHLFFSHNVFFGRTGVYEVGLETAQGMSKLVRGAAHIHRAASERCMMMLDSSSPGTGSSRAELSRVAEGVLGWADEWGPVAMEYGPHEPATYRVAGHIAERLEVPFRKGIDIVLTKLRTAGVITG